MGLTMCTSEPKIWPPPEVGVRAEPSLRGRRGQGPPFIAIAMGGCCLASRFIVIAMGGCC